MVLARNRRVLASKSHSAAHLDRRYRQQPDARLLSPDYLKRAARAGRRGPGGFYPLELSERQLRYCFMREFSIHRSGRRLVRGFVGGGLREQSRT